MIRKPAKAWRREVKDMKGSLQGDEPEKIAAFIKEPLATSGKGGKK